MKKLLFIAFVSSLLLACGNNPAVNSNANTGGAGGGNIANTNSLSANVANTNTNANNKPAVDNSPKRISFGKGQNWGSSNVTLAPGATQLFVVSAKAGQTMDIETSSKDIAVNLRKGKAETTEDFGYLNAELQSTGDFIFELKNISKKEVKTSVKITIEGGNPKSGKTNEIDESDASVKDDADVPPPPAKPTPKEN